MKEDDESALRARLGIPQDAERVIVFAESSHWDPDWLFTSREYYLLSIRRILRRAVKALLEDPLRVFSVESVFFFRMFWEKEPGLRDVLRDLTNAGRIRFSGTGVTQPDTAIPSTEAIMRDFFLGREWLRSNGIDSEPAIAYMTDDFGLTPAFPSILASLGLRYAACSRIDGHFFVGTDYSLGNEYPLEGSSARELLENQRTTDIVWSAPDGSDVLLHLNLKDYNYGNAIAMRGIARWMDLMAGVPARSEAHVERFVERFLREHLPLALTPYLFCPIGGDFNSPLRGLTGLLCRYNESAYPSTGVFLVLAALEDYMDLLSFHRDELPRVMLDPNPNFMGFYFSRPSLKAGCRELTDDLITAEKLSFIAGIDATRMLEKPWWMAAMTNHHDFVTGTSPARVLDKEQVPWVEEARMLTRRTMERVELQLPPAGTAPDVNEGPGAVPRVERSGTLTRISTASFLLEIDSNQGGCVSLADASTGKAIFAGKGLDAVLYRDSGGLWRMGGEFRGGSFSELCRSSDGRAAVDVTHLADGWLRVTSRSCLRGGWVIRSLFLSGSSPFILAKTFAAPGDHSTLTCRFPVSRDTDLVSMDVAGGVVDRPPVKTYDPTFWSAQSFFHLPAGTGDHGLALIGRYPMTVGADRQGNIELVVARNASRELAYHLLPVPAFPARGRDPSVQVADFAVVVTPPGDWRSAGLHQACRSLAGFWKELPGLYSRAQDAVTVDHPDVCVLAVKGASNDEGHIVRLVSYAGRPLKIALEAPGRKVLRAFLCDAMERDLAEVAVENGRALVPVERSITSVRLLCG